MTDRLEGEDSALRSACMSLPVGLIGDVVVLAQVPVQYDDGDRTGEGAQGDDGRDPERPSIGPKVPGNDVGRGLTRKLCQVGYTPGELVSETSDYERKAAERTR